MKRSTFLSISAALAVFFGLSMLFMSSQILTWYGMTLNEGSLLIVRSFGSMIFCVGLINWIARNSDDSLALRAILYGNLSIHALGLVIDLIGITSGAINAQGWVSVVLHLILGGGFAYYTFAKPKAA